MRDNYSHIFSLGLLSRKSRNFDFGAASTSISRPDHLKELAINSAAVRSGLSSASMTAVFVPRKKTKRTHGSKIS
jgi:hypothetical protein